MGYAYILGNPHIPTMAFKDQTFPWRGGAWGITPAERNVATGEKKWGYRLVQLRYRWVLHFGCKL